MFSAIGRTEFPSWSPKKSGTGHRLYRRKDVELLLRIKHLLYQKRFTIDGARQFLHEEAKSAHQEIKHEQQILFFLSVARNSAGIDGNLEDVEVGYSPVPAITV